MRDGARKLSFAGVLLGDASSHEPGKDRWIELRIYRTTGGRYVVERIGKTHVRGERDRFWAQVSSTAEGVIECLYLEDGDGVAYLTNVAKDVLTAAASNDRALEAAFAVETVD